MKSEYAEWIAANVQTYAAAYGQCKKVSEKMVAAFPELRIARGFFWSLSWGRREHQWCVAPDGAIVDPTESQYPGGGDHEELHGTVEELVANGTVPTGRCMDCGEDVYRNATFCNDACEAATRAYLEDPRSDAEKEDDKEPEPHLSMFDGAPDEELPF